MTIQISRRLLLLGSSFMAAIPFARNASASETETETKPDLSSKFHRIDTEVKPKIIDHIYEVGYTEEEWKNRLTEEEFRIMRMGGTEHKKTSKLWNETREGAYKCKGCDLDIYSSEYKVPITKGWVFFSHSEPDSVLTGIDLITNYGWRAKKKAAIEAHCRRCGSHLGHVLYVDKKIVHCINGKAMTFSPTKAK